MTNKQSLQNQLGKKDCGTDWRRDKCRRQELGEQAGVAVSRESLYRVG